MAVFWLIESGASELRSNPENLLRLLTSTPFEAKLKMTMGFEIREREREGIKILDLEGRLTVGPAASQVREAITKLHADGHSRIILNLADVDYIDSTGLGTLVICFTTLQKAGGGMKLLNLNRRNLELLLLTKLSTVFQLFNDEQDAVNSFFPNREIKRFDILDFVQQQEKES